MKKEDMFYWLSQINKASILINSEEGLLDKQYVQPFAETLQEFISEGEAGGPRPASVITYEPYLIDKICPDITRIHAGRSSQDMLATVRIALMRSAVLRLVEGLEKVAKKLIELSAEHRHTIVPAYTNGVAAQPTSYGHYLLAVNEGVFRDLDRALMFYDRLNRSPMGSMVLNGTSWPLNRERMATYLGFEGIAYNTYDATQVFTMEYPIEAAGLCNMIAIRLTNFVEDVMQQYAQPRPWILLQEGGENTYVSSAMPQKRNPGILNGLRAECSSILGDATGAILRAHNIPYGMADARSGESIAMVDRTTKALETFHKILAALRIDSERSLEELNLDWTASQEVADVLMRKYNISFRIGHHIASEMVSYGRANDIKPLDFPYSVVQDIYAHMVEEEKLTGVPAEFPMLEEEFRNTLNPVAIVANRQVEGGPQEAEMEHMLQVSAEQMDSYEHGLIVARSKLALAVASLEEDFEKLLK